MLRIFGVSVAALLPLASVGSALPSEQSIQIVGGTEAAEGEFPFIVSIAYGRGSHSCGGTLLNADTVVTAAHCTTDFIDEPSMVNVRAGSLIWYSGGIQSAVASMYIHPDYQILDGIPFNDVAVWKLATPINETDDIKYATLTSQDSDPETGLTSTIIGWGFTAEFGLGSGLSPTLLKVDVPVLSRDDCGSVYGSNFTDAMWCAGLEAGGKDSCQGDSGGPALDPSNTVIGIVSWGTGCARPGYPGVYTRVGAFVDWINSYL